MDGKYIYCIINANDGRNFGHIGIGGRGDIVSSIGYNDISAVISNTPMTKYVISRENLTCHEKVVEEIMKEYTLLPVRFCTIATCAEELRTMLRRRYSELKGLLRDMDNKVEMGLKIMWKDMDKIFEEITNENNYIKKLKKQENNRNNKIELGKAVEEALKNKKADEAFPIINKLRQISVNVKENDPIGDNMFINSAFLIDRTHEKEFDYRVEELSDKYKDRVKFKYVGPAPPYNFVNLELEW